MGLRQFLVVKFDATATTTTIITTTFTFTLLTMIWS